MSTLSEEFPLSSSLTTGFSTSLRLSMKMLSGSISCLSMVKNSIVFLSRAVNSTMILSLG